MFIPPWSRMINIGSLYDLMQASGARVLAHEIEAPSIDGTLLPRFARPVVLAQRPELRAVAERFQPTPVDEQLQDGTHLDLAGGVRVVFTPGHTPGHSCLLAEATPRAPRASVKYSESIRELR